MRTLVATALAVLAVPAVRADEAYTIKLKLDVDTGLTATYRSSSKMSRDVKGSLVGDKQFAETVNAEEETTYKETILDRDKDGKPTAYVRVYEKATKVENEKAQTVSYHGRTVLFEKVDGKFRIGVIGEPPLDAKDVSELLKSANRKSDANAITRGLAPARPVKVGDSWSMPVKPIAEYFDFIVMDSTRSSAVAKLVNVYPKASATFGTFELAIKLSFTDMHQQGQLFVTFDPPGTLEISQRVGLAIDGSTSEQSDSGTMTIMGEGKGMLGGKEVRVASSMKAEASSEQSAATNDPTARVRPKVTFAADPSEWVEVKPKDGNFTIRFPVSPKETNNKNKTNTQTRWVAETHLGARAYGLTLIEFENPTKTNPTAIQKAVIASAKGARDIKEIKVGEYTGVEFKVDLDMSGRTLEVIQRTIITKERWFELRVIAPKGNPAEAEKFFKSFEILVKP